MSITIDGTSGIVATGSLTGLTTPISAAQGGTSLAAPGTSGNLLTSNGTTWISAAAPAGMPVGTIITYAGTSAPTGFLLCPTSLTNVSRTTYAALFAAIGTTWGAGDGSTTFGLPWFAADYTAVQANANVGTATVGQVISHSHSYTQASTISSGGGFATNAGTSSTQSVYINATGGSANLAAGVRVLHCIKY